jgi:drug/metabolite transporter (DMT)-like permease
LGKRFSLGLIILGIFILIVGIAVYYYGSFTLPPVLPEFQMYFKDETYYPNAAAGIFVCLVGAVVEVAGLASLVLYLNERSPSKGIIAK